MKVGLLALLTCMNGFVLAVSSYERQLQYEGAPATITMTVRDEHGVPVEGALGEAFYSQWSGKPEKISVRSNEHGNLTFQGGGVYEAIFYITKEGYYETKGRVQFRASTRMLFCHFIWWTNKTGKKSGKKSKVLPSLSPTREMVFRFVALRHLLRN